MNKKYFFLIIICFILFLNTGCFIIFEKVSTPIISFENKIGYALVYIHCDTPNVFIRYTINGQIPTSIYGNIYYSPFRVNSNTTIKAKAFKNWMIDSDVAIKEISIGASTYRVATPIINLPGGIYAGEKTISILCTTSSAIIKYTTDGSEPNIDYGYTYTGPFTISTDTTLKVKAFKNGMLDSETITEEYYFEVIPDWTIIQNKLNRNEGEFNDIEVFGNYAFVATGINGLKIIDISNLNNPYIINAIDTDGDCYSITISGYYLYIADGNKGLKVVNITNINTASIIKSIDNFNAIAVHASGNFLYVVDPLLNVKVFDISNPYNAYEVGYYDNCHSEYVDAKRFSNYLYILDKQYGFVAVNVSDGTDENYNTTYQPQKVYLSGNCAFVLCSNGVDSCLDIFDITNPLAATKIKQIYFYGKKTQDIFIYDNYPYEAFAYITTADGLLYIYDVLNPLLSANQLSAIETKGEAKAVFANSMQVFVANGIFGLMILNVYDKNNPTVLSNSVFGGSTKDIYIANNYAYIADTQIGLVITNINNIYNPYFVNYVRTKGVANKICISQNYAYITTSSYTLEVINISNPTNPIYITSLAPYGGGSYGYDIAIKGNYAYLTTSNNDLKIIDISNPLSLNVVKTINNIGNSQNKIYISGNYLYVAANSNGLKIIDITDPLNAYIKNTISNVNPLDVHVIGNYAYIIDSSKLMILNLANQYILTTYNNIDIPTSIFVSGEYVFVLSNDNNIGKIYSFRINQDFSLIFELQIYLGKNADNILIYKNYAFISNREDGVMIIGE